MADYLKRCWAVVNLDNIAHNIKTIKESLAPGCMLMGVVKADAYGHGDKYIASELVRSGVSWFGVSNVKEALSLRAQGIFHPILILGVTPAENAGLLNEYNLTQTVHCAQYAKNLHDAALEAGVVLNVHIKVDTGMSRLGFMFDDMSAAQSEKEILEIAEYSNFRAQGIFTHFSCADELREDSVEFTKNQYGLFKSIISGLESQGVAFDLKHCCNSAASMLYPEMHMDMARTGIALYGLNPSGDCAGRMDLKPAMQLYSTVSMVKEIDAGATVSYGRRYTASRKTKVATVTIGYADGYGRVLSNKARMLIRGKFADVIGTVCMDYLLLDVTYIDGVAAGDTVTIVGQDGKGSLDFDEMAALSGTINYEKICLIGKRVPRVYRRNGKDVGVVDYIADVK